jgi:hypothetical protein
MAFLFLLTGCLEDSSSPEAALKNFVEARMGNVVTRDYVLERTTGSMKQSLENISDEEFTKFADLRNVEKNSFKIISKSCQEKKCFLTYSVSYLTKDKDASKYTSEVKKIAEVLLEDGKWLIAEVSNIKTYHEALEPINPLE